MRFISVAKELHGRSPVVRFSHNLAAGRPFKPLMACAVFALTLAGAFGATTAQATNAVGTIAGSAGVSATGAATYSIPISLPSGTNGMQPSVALVYNSQSGDGLAGYGWTVFGLSAVTRCNKNIEDDGVTQAVQFAPSTAATDVFCLDGQRLILKGGSGFSNGSSYSPVIQNFSQINSYTDANATNGPSWFQIKTKDGRVYDYGSTTDSKIYAQGTTHVRVWALHKIVDPNGNYISYTYNNASGGVEYSIASIDYTGNCTDDGSGNCTGTTIAPDHHVVFTYQARPATPLNSVRAYYEHGSLITNSQRLSTITVQYGTATPYATTFTYTLGYTQDAANNRSQLTSVKECGKDGTCLPKTLIVWQSASAGWGSDVDTGVSAGGGPAQAAHLMDVDGDGIQDLVYPDSGTGDWMVLFGKPAGGFVTPAVDTGIPAPGSIQTGGGPTYSQYALAADINGDGRMDLVVPIPCSGCTIGSPGGWQVLIATGSRTPGQGGVFRTPPNQVPYLGGENNTTQEPIYQGNVWAVDFSGRGMSDLVYTDGTTMWLLRNTGATLGGSFSAAQAIYTDNGLSKSVAASLTDATIDFDGSGRAGAFAVTSFTDPNTLLTTYTWKAFTSTEQPAFISMASVSGLANIPPNPIDANGDGLSDLLWAGSSQSWQIALDSGAGFQNLPSGLTSRLSSEPVIADYYGDGRQDAIAETTSNVWNILNVTYTPGGSFSLNTPALSAAPYPIGTYGYGSLRVGSIEGGGHDDLVYMVNNGSTTTWHYALHSGADQAFDVVTGITNGLGNV